MDVAACLEGVAALAETQGELESAARLFGAGGAMREALRTPVLATARATSERVLASSSPRLAEDAFRAAWAAG